MAVMATAFAAQKPPLGQKMPQAWSRPESRSLSQRMHREKCRPLVRLASGAPVFANGAATAAMSYALSNLGRRKSGGQSGGEMTDEQIDEYIANNPIELNLDEAIAFQPPSLPQWLVDGAAGFGDTLSFGATRWVRGRMGIGAVDYDSAAYLGGSAGSILAVGPVGGTVRGAVVIGGRITGYTRHGLNSAISHPGGGVSLRAMRDTVASPVRVTNQSGGRVMYHGQNANVLLNSRGQVITAYPTSSAGRRLPPGP